jgi:beta-hydroxylase
MNKYIIIIFIIIIIIIIFSEINRLQGNIHLTPFEYYTSGRFILAPYSVICDMFTQDGSKPFPNMDVHFSNHNLLKENFSIIRDEALNIYNSNNASKIKNDMFFDGIADEGWKKFYIKWYGDITPESYNLCPKTVELIKQLPEVKLAMFSILEPGSIIKPHTGPFKGCVRYHLGLDVPEKDAFIMIDGNKYEWKNGEDILFDDTYYHEVKNLSNKKRIILFIDVEKKMTNNIAQFINNSFINILGPLSTRANDLQEKKTHV